MRAADPLKYRMRFLILSLLAIKPSHGYDLSKKIEKITEGFIKGSPGSLYPLLRDLKDQGLIDEETIVEGGRLKKVYKLTEKGARMILSEIEMFYEVSNRLLELAIEARRALQKRLGKWTPDTCPDPELIRRLERLRDAIDEYISSLKEKLELCGGKDAKSQEASKKD